MISALLVYKILQLFLIMIIGFIIAKLKIIKSDDSVVLSKISLYLLMPSAIINSFDFEISDDLVLGLVLAFAAAIIIHIIFLLFDKLYIKFFGKNPVERTSNMYSNAANLIIPIVTFILGEEWVIYSTAYLTVQLLFLWTHGIRVFWGNTKFNIKNILLNVNIIAIFFGICLMIIGLRLPPFIKGITSSLGSMLGPVGMLIAGMLATQINLKKVFTNKRIYFVAIIRLIIYPLIILIIVRLLSNVPIVNANKILLISFLASTTPSATTVMQFAQINCKDTDFAVAINVFTTVLCIVTMPLLVTLYNL